MIPPTNPPLTKPRSFTSEGTLQHHSSPESCRMGSIDPTCPYVTSPLGGSEATVRESFTGGGGGGENVVVSAGLALLAIGVVRIVWRAPLVKAAAFVHGKRTRDGGGPPLEGQPLQCPVCSSFFPSNHSLSGHMNIPPDRAWQGIHPHPIFSRNEFGDILRQAAEEVVAAEKAGDGVDMKEEPSRKLLDLNRTPSPDE
ncbi:hypothetical protein Acr_05g0014650 [Actinidia rufa]|uniref:C2H2-type domain-containing protein n=1 Tax=Actinidia rufa TaxID=165716 RepID=A0A7J0ENS4_9ERIC|nr:hypothetical protein Acr_05g0014650 [Actinidia rufa]